MIPAIVEDGRCKVSVSQLIVPASEGHLVIAGKPISSCWKWLRRGVMPSRAAATPYAI